MISLLTSLHGPQALHDTHWRNFDARPVAASISGPARQALGGPIRVLVGPAAVAAAVALALPEKPLVLIDGRLDRSPWVPESLISACGAVELGEAAQLRDGTSLWPALPGWSYRVRRPVEDGAGLCRIRAIP